jgi:hypothetical protein
MQPYARCERRARLTYLLDKIRVDGETSEQVREALELLYELEAATCDPEEVPTRPDFRITPLPEPRITPYPHPQRETPHPFQLAREAKERLDAVKVNGTPKGDA